MEYSFEAGHYLKIIIDKDNSVEFNYEDNGKITFGFQVGTVPSDAWPEIFKCLKKAKRIIKKIRRL